MRIFFILMLFPYITFGQQSEERHGINLNKVTSIFIYHPVPVDSIQRKRWDSLLNSTIKVEWEISLQRDNNVIRSTRYMKRLEGFYLNQSSHFYDSEKPTKHLGSLSVLNKFSNELIGKKFHESFSISRIDDKRQYLIDIRPFDTINYLTTLFFLQKIPPKLKENDFWIDSVANGDYVIKNKFIVKGLIGNRLTLRFEGSVCFKNSDPINSVSPSDEKSSLNFYNSSSTSEGSLIIDTNTDFVELVEAAVQKRSIVKDGNTVIKMLTASYSFKLINKIE